MDVVVGVFGYSRPLHLQKVLHALKEQLNGSPLPLHVFLDGSRSPADTDKVHRTRSVVREFAEVCPLELHLASENLGLYRSLTQGVSHLLEQHDAVIVLEDDILTSPFFLSYMLKGLALYRDQPKVASISGYSPEMDDALPETFFLRGADCWGWATWRERWALYRHDAATMALELHERDLISAFDPDHSCAYYRLLLDRAQGRSESWAICWYASCFLADCYTLHPGRSLVQSIGLDYSGENCAPAPLLASVLATNPVEVLPQAVKSQEFVLQAYRDHFSQRRPLNERISAIGRRCYAASRAVLKALVPFRLRRLLRGRMPLDGPYTSYREASKNASGYASTSIVAMVESAAQAVLRGECGYARDGTVFAQPPADLAICRLLADHLHPGDVIVDFGGGLGGTFINHADLFPPGCRRIVVEQPVFVKRGTDFSTENQLDIRFMGDLTEVPEVDIVLASGVLQYLEDYAPVIKSFNSLSPRIILLDRTALATRERWYVQRCAGYGGGDARIPLRPLNLARIQSLLPDYTLSEQWSNSFDAVTPRHRGLLFVRRSLTS
ncbi:methyltransferase, TIGR04325 family [Synechococcus sp. CCY 9618]|uniref:methyltransferase, TIGR04325 family n=1 Tax=Synechococcus sp. CCY 9618 TaxID=2815602 RepID=UPI001C21630D|nr:methyltransferase, TIGR04325 family [Synechococcus sp. CCY 9618]